MPNYFEPEIECASRETLRQIQSQRLGKIIIMLRARALLQEKI